VTNVPGSSLGLLSRLWLREPDSEALAASREFPSVAPHAGDEPAAMATAYADLFLLNVYPYGTAFTDPSGELGGPNAGWTARRYEDRGFRPPELLEVGAPDHVGLCLGFLEHLARGGEKDIEFCSSLLEWVPICCVAVEREPSAHPFYRAVAAVTRERLMEDIPESLQRAFDREESAPEGTDPEEEDVGLSQVVRLLLAPARSGLYLSRAKLGQFARAAGMRLPFGSRFDVARLLFQTAGEWGKVGQVLDLLGEELSGWESAYGSWAEEHRRWAPSAARWLNRTGETRRMLGQMREILENPPELEYADGMSGRETRGSSGTLK
jgi:putative dimethyl sulfoxide reductase chaperone